MLRRAGRYFFETIEADDFAAGGGLAVGLGGSRGRMAASGKAARAAPNDRGGRGRAASASAGATSANYRLPPQRPNCSRMDRRVDESLDGANGTTDARGRREGQPDSNGRRDDHVPNWCCNTTGHFLDIAP